MKTNSKRRGFSLMEVLIAMGIAGVGLCGIMTALPVIAHQVQKIRSQVSGIQLANLARETILLQEWADKSNTNLNEVEQDGTDLTLFKVPIAFFDQPFLIDPWSDTTNPPFPACFAAYDAPLDGGNPDDFKSFFTDPTSLKVSANPDSERPELTYVSLNGSIAPDRNDDYSWFYTVLPKMTSTAAPLDANYYNINAIDSFQVSVIVSRGRAFDDSPADNSGSHRVYEIDRTVSGKRADTVYLNEGDAAIGKYAAVIILDYPTVISPTVTQYGSYLCWYKVLMARATGGTPPTQTRVLLQRITGDPVDLALPTLPSPVTDGFLVTADSIIEVQSFSVQ